MSARPGARKEDVWSPTSCGGCCAQCCIRCRRVDGKVVEIEGNPESPAGRGRIYAKGSAHLMTLYDPFRANCPVKRKNPRKGVDVDPKWQRITGAAITAFLGALCGFPGGIHAPLAAGRFEYAPTNV